MKTLILVDIQNDFLPGGALAVTDGDQVIAVANHLMPKFDLVVATQDWHPADHGSFASQHNGIEIGDAFMLNGVVTNCLAGSLHPKHVGAELLSQHQRDRSRRAERN